MINGVDLLLVVAGLILLLLIWNYVDHYNEWAEWNHNRRRQRKLDRYAMQDQIEEKEYRRMLRWTVRIQNQSLSRATKRAQMSVERFDESIKQLNKVLENA